MAHHANDGGRFNQASLLWVVRAKPLFQPLAKWGGRRLAESPERRMPSTLNLSTGLRKVLGDIGGHLDEAFGIKHNASQDAAITHHDDNIAGTLSKASARPASKSRRQCFFLLSRPFMKLSKSDISMR